MTKEELLKIAINKCTEKQDCKGCPLDRLDTSDLIDCTQKGVEAIYFILGEENVDKL